MAEALGPLMVKKLRTMMSQYEATGKWLSKAEYAASLVEEEGTTFHRRKRKV
ncbi:hypothetical protein [Bradyrhizobium cenepequi]|uniref:hypothetical protein n=1 Tax=Bradyrhizobium cenepequi TaxID=2821403 RepID=UPI001CE2F803|nr:hypothetical protein [Bradyrhizobium cenepequi]MCA6108128.1 hypothetical protein [Bradyrhizobium cenepequi]